MPSDSANILLLRGNSAQLAIALRMVITSESVACAAGAIFKRLRVYLSRQVVVCQIWKVCRESSLDRVKCGRGWRKIRIII